MTAEKYTQLSHVHFEQQLWHHELGMIASESDFFLNLLKTLQDEHLICTKHEQAVGDFFNHIHHFQRLTKKLNEELDTIEKEMALGVINDDILDKEQRLDHQYLRQEMDYLEQNYRIFKNNFRTFIANTHFGRN